MKSSRAFVSAALSAAALVGAPLSASAAEPLVEIDWNRTVPLSGVVVEGSVKIASNGNGGTFPLVAIKRPPVGGAD